MANVDDAKGFYPIRHFCGGEIRTNSYTLTTSDTVYIGDPVKAVVGGTVTHAAGTDGIIIVGVSAEYVASGAAGQKIQVYDDPYIVFGIQCDTGTAAASTDVFSTADMATYAAGSSSSGLSGCELDASDLATGAQSLLKVLGLVNTPLNAWGEHADVEVLFNEHLFKAAVAGVTS
jgi:hypothetical protein